MSTTAVEAPDATGYDDARIITVAQIVDGEATCHCGASAVLVVDTEPDNEPGPTCYKHAHEWIDLTLGLVDRLFNPSTERTR
jgi:hypothetical protein